MNDDSIAGRILIIIVLGIAGLFFWPLLAVAAFLGYALSRDLSNLEPERLPVSDPRRVVRPSDPDWRNAFMQACESPAESAFLTAMIEHNQLLPSNGLLQNDALQLDMQVPIGRYRADFVINARLVVEIDGAAYHGSPEAKARDAERDQWMQSEGYHVLRIAAKTALSYPRKATSEVERAIAAHGTHKQEKAPIPNHGSFGGHVIALVRDTGHAIQAVGEAAAYVNRSTAIIITTQEAIKPLQEAISQERMIIETALKTAESKAEIDRYTADPDKRRRYEESRRMMNDAIKRASGGTYDPDGPCNVSFSHAPSVDDVRLNSHDDAEINASIEREENSLRASHSEYIRSSLSALVDRPELESHFWNRISWLDAPKVERMLRRERSQIEFGQATPSRPSQYARFITEDDIPY